MSPVLLRRQQLLHDLDQPGPDAGESVRSDERSHLEDLVPPGFASSIEPGRLEQLPRYLETMTRRLDRLRGPGLERDRVRREEFEGWKRLLVERQQRLDRLGRIDPATLAFRWSLEEYRVQLFAQELGTGEKVSPAILKQAWRALGGL